MLEKTIYVEEFYNSDYATENGGEPYWDEDYIGPVMSPDEEENHIQMMEEKSNSTDENIRLESLQYPCPISVLEKLSELLTGRRTFPNDLLKVIS